MRTVHTVFENGVFCPTRKVELLERCEVEFEPCVVAPTVADQIADLQRNDPRLAAVYEVLSRRHQSGHDDIAERHNEHQP